MLTALGFLSSAMQIIMVMYIIKTPQNETNPKPPNKQTMARDGFVIKAVC